MIKLSLRPVARSDAPKLIVANRASASLHHPWTHPFTDSDGFEDYLGETGDGRMVGLVARELATGSAIGVLNLSQIFRQGFQSCYLGFYGLAGHGGRGLMTEAVRMTLAYAFGDLGLHRVEANVQPNNARSIALVQRVGFRKEGFSPRYLYIDGDWRDHERWAFLADEFTAEPVPAPLPTHRRGH